MPASFNATQAFIGRLRESLDRLRAAQRLAPQPAAPSRPPRASRTPDRAGVGRIWDHLLTQTAATEADRAQLADPATLDTLDAYARNIEGMTGTTKVPVGLAGPLRVSGLYASGDYLVPPATTEAALVASYDRGSRAVTLAGGAVAALINEGMLRSPGFGFASVYEAGMFASWCVDAFGALRATAEATTRHGKLIEVAQQLAGDNVFLLCRYTTGDAAGQNMATIATEALCRHAVAQAPVQPRHWFVEANLSGEEGVRPGGPRRARPVSHGDRAAAGPPGGGHPAHHAGADAGLRPHGRHRWRAERHTLGIQAHVANGLAALYLATGQDVACVAESAGSVTRLGLRGPNLFCSMTLPSLVLGTVGGGTGLPSQAASLNILGLAGPGKAAALAEVAAAVCLAGEISIIAALSAGQFTDAHRNLARGRA